MITVVRCEEQVSVLKHSPLFQPRDNGPKHEVKVEQARCAIAEANVLTCSFPCGQVPGAVESVVNELWCRPDDAGVPYIGDMWVRAMIHSVLMTYARTRRGRKCMHPTRLYGT